MIFTENEKKVLRFICASGTTIYSINELSNNINISAASAYKVFTKFKEEGVIIPSVHSNIITPQLNFANEKTKAIIELFYINDELHGRVKMRAQDFALLKKITKICILFGSYITPKTNPSDLDVLFVFEKENFEEYKKNLAKVQLITPIKIQDIIQTKEDFIQNIKKQDSIIVEALKNGIVLWGYETLVEMIKNANE